MGNKGHAVGWRKQTAILEPLCRSSCSTFSKGRVYSKPRGQTSRNRLPQDIGHGCHVIKHCQAAIRVPCQCWASWSCFISREPNTVSRLCYANHQCPQYDLVARWNKRGMIILPVLKGCYNRPSCKPQGR